MLILKTKTMDILNFISWIRGRRQVTSVDPNKTLLPVGLKDPKRDDGYLAGAISVADFANQIGGSSPSTLVIDGDESDYYKYGDLYTSDNIPGILNYLSIFTSKNLEIKNIEGTSNIKINYNSNNLENITIENCQNLQLIVINGYFLKNILITNSPALQLYIAASQLQSLTIPSGLTDLGVYGEYSNGQFFGLSTAPDLTPSENTLTYIEFDVTQIQFTDANYFQIANKANVTYLWIGRSIQNNNTLPLGLFNGYTGLSLLDAEVMNLETIESGMFSFLESTNSGMFIGLFNNALTEESIDNIITDCLDRATNNGAVNITLNISGGTNATPSVTALADIATLVGTYGWTILYNP